MILSSKEIIDKIKASNASEQNDLSTSFPFSSETTGFSNLKKIQELQQPIIFLSRSAANEIALSTSHSLVPNKVRDFEVIDDSASYVDEEVNDKAFNCILIPPPKEDLKGVEFDIDELFFFDSGDKKVLTPTAKEILQVKSESEIDSLKSDNSSSAKSKLVKQAVLLPNSLAIELLNCEKKETQYQFC